jgi:hypothetical protein
MKVEARKAAVAAYKERKVVGGVFLVRCETSGQIWVGHWPDLSTIQTRIWFALRHDTYPRKDLLDAWRKHGEDSFSFEIMERLEDETSSYVRAAKLKERSSYWRETLGAGSI